MKIRILGNGDLLELDARDKRYKVLHQKCKFLSKRNLPIFTSIVSFATLFVFVSDFMLIGIIFNMMVCTGVPTVLPLRDLFKISRGIEMESWSCFDTSIICTELFSIPWHASCSIRPLSVMNSVIAFAPTFMQLATIFFIRCAIARLNTKTGYRGGE